jgi:hypothetical protein
MKLKLIMLVSVFAFGLAFNASAGSVTDSDSDLVPDQFDNCSSLKNGPGETSNQVDTDLDGYGNRCDPDFNNSGAVSGADFTPFVANFNTGEALYDLNGDGVVSGADFTIFIAFFNQPPGPSGLACAGTVPCIP